MGEGIPLGVVSCSFFSPLFLPLFFFCRSVFFPLSCWCGFHSFFLPSPPPFLAGNLTEKTMALWLCVAVFLSLVPRGALSTALECPEDYEWLGKKGVVMKWIKSEALGKCYAISRKWTMRPRRR